MERIDRRIRTIDNWKPINTFNMARRMSKNKMAAARIRARYLREQIELCRQDGHVIALFWADEMEAEMNKLLTEGRRADKTQSNDTNAISDADVDRARTYPVEGLVEWTRGKARCWLHEDKTPSIFHANRMNKVRCPVCDKNLNAIDILMTRDGYSFVEAVRHLR